MDLVDVEIILGRERIVFYYLAEKRVDFRELVKDLARAFRTRIEMRQIGVRDEAKLLADYGDCGKPVCCNTHLTAMPPVSMKMAKLQKTTLDPAKISGRCGRLKCCLRYEFDTYRALERELPPVGSHGDHRQGAGTGRGSGDPGPEARRGIRGSPADHRRPRRDPERRASTADGSRPAGAGRRRDAPSPTGAETGDETLARATMLDSRPTELTGRRRPDRPRRELREDDATMNFATSSHG